MCSVSWRSFHCRRRSAFPPDEPNRPVVSAVGIAHARFQSAQLRGRFALRPRGAGLWIAGRRRSYGTYSLCHATNFHPVTLVFVDAFRDPGHVGECRSQPGNGARQPFDARLSRNQKIQRHLPCPSRQPERSKFAIVWRSRRTRAGITLSTICDRPARPKRASTHGLELRSNRRGVGPGLRDLMRCDSLPDSFVASFAGRPRL